MSMKITFNNTIFYQQKRGGISRYITCLASEFVKLNQNVNIIAPIHKNHFLKQFPKKYYSGIYISNFPLISVIDKLSNYIVNRELKKNNPQIIHDTYYSKDIYKPSISKKIITVHDLIHEKFKKLYKNSEDLIKLKRDAFKDCDHFICVSENTKKDLLNFYNIDDKKVSVIYHGSDHFKNLKLKSEKFFDFPYLLYVGNRSKYKNFDKFLEVYSNSDKINKNFNLICFGGNQVSSNEINQIKKLKVRKKIFFINGSDDYLKNIYSNARAFIFPSAYEGFGLPLIESMSLNCPVFCSDKSSFPEVCANAAILFDPDDKEEFKFKLENYLFDDEKLKQLKSRGLNHSEKFKWKDAAKKTLNLYKNLLEN